jgi:hypothetical protein
MNDTSKWQQHVLERSSAADATYKFAIAEARMDLASGREKRDRAEYMEQWNATIVKRNRKAEKSKEAKADREAKLGKIMLLKSEAGSVDIETLMKLTVTKLDEQIDKLRSIDSSLISPKSSFKGTINGKTPKQRKCEAISAGLKAAEELDLAESEPEHADEQDEDIELVGDEEMMYPDEIF